MKTSLLSVLFAFTVSTIAAQAKISVTDTHTYPVAATGAISLKNVNGEVVISTWDKDEVSVETVRTGKTQDDLDRTRVTAEIKGDTLVLATQLEKKGFWGSVDSSVRYHLQVPAGITLDQVSTVNGSITVTGVTGPVRLSTVNGNIRATGLAGDASLATTNGSVTAEVTSVQAIQDIRLKTVNGSTELDLPKGAPAGIRAHTVNGRVAIAQAIASTRSSRHSVSGQIGQGGPSVEIGTVNGSVRIDEK